MKAEKCLKSGVSSPSIKTFTPQDPKVLIWNSRNVYVLPPFKEPGKVSRCMFSVHCPIVLTNNLWRGACFILFCLLKASCLAGLWISCLAAHWTLAPTLVHVYTSSSPPYLRCSTWWRSQGRGTCRLLPPHTELCIHPLMPNPHCASLGLTSHLPHHVWPLPSKSVTPLQQHSSWLWLLREALGALQCDTANKNWSLRRMNFTLRHYTISAA